MYSVQCTVYTARYYNVLHYTLYTACHAMCNIRRTVYINFYCTKQLRDLSEENHDNQKSRNQCFYTSTWL